MAYIATPLPHYIYVPRTSWKTLPPGLQADLFFEAEETDDGDTKCLSFGFREDQSSIMGMLLERLKQFRHSHFTMHFPEAVQA